jgi:RNA polymerase sigma-70 factor (ECF subfamily)
VVHCDDLFTSEASSSRTSTGLLRAAKANDPDAWTMLVRSYSRMIYRWCRQAGLQPADAGNIVQEVLRSVARKLKDFEHRQSDGSFRGWLRTVTRNKLRDGFRKDLRSVERAAGGTAAQKLVESIPDPEVDSVLTFGPPREQVGPATIEKVRGEFSARDWRVFWRMTVDGQSAREAGSEFEMTPNAARIVKTRILRRLREELSAKSDASKG